MWGGDEEINKKGTDLEIRASEVLPRKDFLRLLFASLKVAQDKLLILFFIYEKPLAILPGAWVASLPRKDSNLRPTD